MSRPRWKKRARHLEWMADSFKKILPKKACKALRNKAAKIRNRRGR